MHATPASCGCPLAEAYTRHSTQLLVFYHDLTFVISPSFEGTAVRSYSVLQQHCCWSHVHQRHSSFSTDTPHIVCCCKCMLPVAPLSAQALWRGYKVRQRCGRAGRDARRRLAAVAAAAEAAPQRRIGVRTREALDVLLASRQCSQVRVTGWE